MDDLSVFRLSNFLYNQEPMSRYRPGGFHPVCLGDTFDEGRYEVYHKLGWGGFSTVWLARDAVLEIWVAIKIMTAESCTEQSRELSALRSSQQNGTSEHIVRLLGSFIHQGPNGSHQCLVFELLGPTVDHVVSDYHASGDRLEPENILQVTKQLLQGVASIHRAGYAHGDISGSNIAFTIGELAHSSNEVMLKTIGRPEWVALLRVDGEPLGPGLPAQLVKNAGWDDWIDEDEEDIRLIDLGEAFAKGTEPARLAQPAGLEAPETIFMDRFDHKVDLWRAGCTIYSMVFAARPFQFLGDRCLVIAQMIHFVEDLPAEWRPQWEVMKDKAGRTWNTLEDKPAQSKLEQRFDELVHEPSLRPLLHVIRGLVRFLPADRISAAEALELLEHEDLRC